MSIICCKKYFWLVRKGDFLLIKSHLWHRQNFSLRHQYNSKQTSNENKEKYQLGDYWLIQFQILQTNIIWIVWQTVRRITHEILGVKGLTLKYLYISLPLLDLIIPIWQFGREPDPSIDCSSHVTQLCRELGGVTICRKGQEDIIADGKDGKCRSHKSCVHFSLQFCMYLWKVLFIGSWTSHLQSPLGPSTIWRRTINALSSASVFTHLKKLYIDVKTPLQTPFLQPPINYTIKYKLFLVWITSTFCSVLVKHGRGNSQHFFPIETFDFFVRFAFIFSS